MRSESETLVDQPKPLTLEEMKQRKARGPDNMLRSLLFCPLDMLLFDTSKYASAPDQNSSYEFYNRA